MRITIALVLMTCLPAAAAPVRFDVDACTRLALARAPAAQAAAFDLDAALARLRAARAAYAPRLSVQGEYGRSGGFDEVVTNGGSTAALLTLEASVFDGGLRDAQFAAAGARVRAAQALAQQRRADVVYAVRVAYFTAVAANAEETIHEGTVQSLRDYEDLLRRQEQLGLVPHNDVLRARLAVEAARAAQRAAAAERDTALGELATVTGVPMPAAALVDPPLTSFTPADPATVDTSPVLLDAQAAVEAVRREADAIRGEWRGHADLTASAGALGVTPDHTFTENGGGQFLVGITVPLYDGGATTARLAAALAAAESAAATLRETRQTLVTALARVRVEAARADADVQASRTLVPPAAENFELMRARYFGGGNVRLLEVLDALAQSVDAQVAVQQALLAGRLVAAKQQQLVGVVTP